jgi:hypothetical protein
MKNIHTISRMATLPTCANASAYQSGAENIESRQSYGDSSGLNTFVLFVSTRKIEACHEI